MRTILLPASEKRISRSVRGEVLLTDIGAGQWLCPPGVTKVSVAMISAGTFGGYSGNTVRGGAGGTLRYKNDIDVVPGQLYDVFVGRGNSSGSNARSSAFGIVAYPPAAGTSTPTGQDGVEGFHGGSMSPFTSAVNVIPNHGDPARFDQTGGVSNLMQESANGLDLDGEYGPLEPFGKSGYYFFMNGTNHGTVVGRSSNGYDLRYVLATHGAIRIVWGKDRAFPNSDIAYE